MDKQVAFTEFKKEEEGRLLETSIRENRHELKTVKMQLKELTETCNKTKKNIDNVKSELDLKQDERRQNMQHHMAAQDDDDMLDDEDAPQEIIDEDELVLLQRMKELKKDYRAAYT